MAGIFAAAYDKAIHGVSSQFVWTNRSKESFAIDVKSPLGQRAMAALLPRADVFLQNLAPGAAARLGALLQPVSVPLPERDFHAVFHRERSLGRACLASLALIDAA